jgi:quercetin dioxygenase-like cupin family protein
MKRILLTIAIIIICFVVKSQYNKEIIIEPILKTDTTTIGQKIIYSNFQDDEITISKITIPSESSTGWHKHEFPVFAYIIKGKLTVELENNKIMQFSENSSFAEVINTFHNGVNKGKDDVVLIAFFMGGKGVKLSVHKE